MLSVLFKKILSQSHTQTFWTPCMYAVYMYIHIRISSKVCNKVACENNLHVTAWR